MIGMIIASYFIICVLIAQRWLDNPIAGLVLPFVVFVWFMNKKLHKKVYILGIEVSFE